MIRLSLVLAATAALLATALLTVRPDSDVAAVLGSDHQIGTSLESPSGRAMTIAISGADLSVRNTAAQAGCTTGHQRYFLRHSPSP